MIDIEIKLRMFAHTTEEQQGMLLAIEKVREAVAGLELKPADPADFGAAVAVSAVEQKLAVEPVVEATPSKPVVEATPSEPANDTDAPAATYDDIKTAVGNASMRDKPRVVAILDSFGVSTAKGLPSEQWGAFLAALRVEFPELGEVA